MSSLPRMRYVSLQWRIGAAVLGGMLVLLLLLSFLSTLLTREGSRRLSNEFLAIADLTASIIDHDFEEQFERLESGLATASQALDGSERREALLRDLFRQLRPFAIQILLVDQAGHVVAAEPPGTLYLDPELLTHPQLREPLLTGARYASGVQAAGPGGRPVVILAVPIADAGGSPAGVLAAATDPSLPAFRALVTAAQRLGPSGHGELLDQDARVIVSSEPGRALGPADHEEFVWPLLRSRAHSVGTAPPLGPERPAERGHRHVTAVAPLDSLPWVVSLGSSEADFAALAGRWRTYTVVIGAAALAIPLAVVWLTLSNVVRPVWALTGASRRIAAGDLATPVPRTGEGEVRVLAEAFDEMRRRLQQALDALAIEKSRYQGIVESMSHAVVATDAQYRITSVNPAAEALTGWRAAEIVGRHCCDVIQAAEGQSLARCRTLCPMLPEAAESPPTITKELLRRRDGQPVLVAAVRSIIHGRDGTPQGTVHVLRDISAEEEVSRLKEQFLSTVSHELRTPLGFVKGYATTLLLPNGLQDEQTTRRCLEVIVEASDELQELVDNLLDMAKIGAGALEVEPQAVQFGPLIRAAVARARLRAPAHRLRASVPAALPVVRADPRRIEQVLYNLLDNAAKYSPAGSAITVAAAASGAEVTVSVVDEGFGIPPGELDKLFERFYRGSVARTQRIGGSGLGLAICQGIVEAHGGRIWAESPVMGRPPGAPPGTAVSFTLPIAAGAALPETDGTAPEEEALAVAA